MLYVHDLPGGNGHLEPRAMEVKRWSSPQKEEGAPTETLTWSPRLDEQGRKTKILPHIVTRTRCLNGIRQPPELLNEWQPSFKLPIEPVGSTFVFWKTLYRLITAAGWKLSPYLQKLFDALEYYLMLGEF